MPIRRLCDSSAQRSGSTSFDEIVKIFNQEFWFRARTAAVDLRLHQAEPVGKICGVFSVTIPQSLPGYRVTPHDLYNLRLLTLRVGTVGPGQQPLI